MEKTYLKNFCIHRFFLFVKKSNHLNSQVCWQATNFGLQKKKKNKLQKAITLNIHESFLP